MTDVAQDVAIKLVSYGALGICLILALIALYRKDKECTGKDATHAAAVAKKEVEYTTIIAKKDLEIAELNNRIATKAETYATKAQENVSEVGRVLAALGRKFT